MYKFKFNPDMEIAIGPTGFEGITGYELLPDGRLIGAAVIDTPEGKKSALIELDRSTGQGAS